MKLKLLLCVYIGIMYAATSQSTQQGGFLYGWDQYSSDIYTGLGPRTINWDSSGMATIIHAPDTGIHPRVYFGPSEIPEIINRLENTQSGKAVNALLRAYTILLHKGYSGYNSNATYAKDSFGNRYIDNPGAWSASPYFQKLKDKDNTVWQGVPVKRKHRVAALMSIEAFICLLNKDRNDDPVVGKSYKQRAEELADAMHFWATLAIPDDSVNPNGQNFNNFGGTHMALCYDLNYWALSNSQRKDIRKALNKIIPDTPRHGKNLACYANTSNWSTLNSFEIIINLAIEGEEGYKPGLTKDWMRALHNFITYGWYPSGAGYEGLGKNYQFVTTLIAAAKRGYSLLPHPHVRAYGEDYLNAIMQPFGEGFTSYDVWGGSGYDPVKGKYKFNSSDAVGLKFAFPENDKIDFVWRNYIDGWHKTNSRGYVYSQIAPDDSYNNYLIPAAVFALDYSTDDWQSQSNRVISKDYLASDRGLAVFKSSSDKKALSVQFHARQDMGGHTHGDRLDFTLSGLGRVWIRKTYGGSQFQPSKYHSMVLVNDKGVPITDRDGDKSRQPATLLGHMISDKLSTVTADATYAYTWEWHWNDRLASQDHQWVGVNGWEKVTETFNDFLVTPKTENHFKVPIYDYKHWHKPQNLERIVKKKVNPMQKVARTVGLLRERHPMLLVVDDIRKDENIHNYKWTAQLARGLQLDRYDVNLKIEDYRNDIILKEPAGDGNRRLLIRILENTNFDDSKNPGYLEALDYIDVFNGNPFTPNPNWERKRLIVESNSVSPNFKVLLFPYEQGDELPKTKWNTNKDLLTIIFSDQKRSVRFYKNDDENTQMELVDNNEGDLEMVTILGQSINKYVTSKDITLKANIDTAGENERFTMVKSTNGTVSFKGRNGKYVSSENGIKAMTCNRNGIGSWEKFTLEPLSDDLYAIKGNNGKYVSHENGNKALQCNRDAIGSWEKFIIKGVNTNPPSCIDVSITIILDDYPAETSWQITNADNQIVASGGTYDSTSGGSTITVTECLNPGTYTFTINDSYSDGICCSYGNGAYSLSAENVILASGGEFGEFESTSFTLGETGKESHIIRSVTTDPVKIKVCPNPVSKNQIVNISAPSNNIRYMLFDLSGRKVTQGKVEQKSIDFYGIKSGKYLMTLYIDGKRSVHSLIFE